MPAVAVLAEAAAVKTVAGASGIADIRYFSYAFGCAAVCGARKRTDSL